MTLSIVPVSFAQVRAFLKDHHRHHPRLTGWKFGCGVTADGVLVGVATAGRPVARVIQNREPLTLEVNRTCTDGTPHANSMLYGALWRAAKALGYTRAFTYIEDGETGASLRAAGWVKVKDIPARAGWAASTADPELKASRDPVGAGGVARQMWEIKSVKS